MNEYRGYRLQTEKGHGFKTIHSIGKGALPKTLSGVYTKPEFAMKAIDQYLIEKEVKKDAKESSSRRGK